MKLFFFDVSDFILIFKTLRRVDCLVDAEDEINVIKGSNAPVRNNETLLVNSRQNLIVVQPDILVSGTTVSNGLGCLRRAVLCERFKVSFAS